MYYNRFRYYDSHIGAFVSQDPLGLAAGENVYRFGPNTHEWIDPLELQCENRPKGGKGKLHNYSPEFLGMENPHFSVETIGNETIHSHQVVIDKAHNTTMTTVNRVPLPKPTATYTFDLPNVEAAQSLQKARLGQNLGVYDMRTNSCLTNSCDVLRAGGADIPNSPVAVRKMVRNIFGNQ